MSEQEIMKALLNSIRNDLVENRRGIVMGGVFFGVLGLLIGFILG